MEVRSKRHPDRPGRFWHLWRIGRGRIVFTVILLVLLTVGAALNVSLYAMPVFAAMGLAVLHTGSLALTAVRPIAGAALSLVPIVLIPMAADPATQFPLPFTIVALITQVLVIVAAGLRASWPVSTAAWLLSMAVALTISYRHGPEGVLDGVVTNQVVFASVSSGMLAAAILARQWGQIRQQLVDERTITAGEQTRRRMAEERARIARELHDVVAHGMSIVTVQATTARYRYPQIDDEVAAEFDEIAANSRRAMSELRGLLGALRNDEDERDTAPQPGLTDVPELIAGAQRAGNRVAGPQEEPLAAPGLSELVSLSAYRIIQEALSNAIRHSPGSEVSVRVDRSEPGRLHLRVSNGPAPQSWHRPASRQESPQSRLGPVGVGPLVFEPAGHGPGTPLVPGAAEQTGTGHGLIGIRERATVLGGSFIGGPDVDGGFSVDVTLPLTGPRESDKSGMQPRAGGQAGAEAQGRDQQGRDQQSKNQQSKEQDGPDRGSRQTREGNES